MRKLLRIGKPLGLGSVKIEVARVEAVERAKRYTLEGLRGDRAAAVANWDAVVKSGLVSEGIHKAVCLLGTLNEQVTAKQVHAPTVAGQEGSEGETFKWFVGNDGILPDRDADLEIRERREWLRPLSEARGKLPTLPQFEWRTGQRR